MPNRKAFSSRLVQVALLRRRCHARALQYISIMHAATVSSGRVCTLQLSPIAED